MQDLLRKHKRAILVFIIVVIAVPFVLFFGMPGKGHPNQTEFKDAPIADVGGVPIMASEFRRRLDDVIQSRSRGENRMTIQELDKNGEADKILKQMVDSALISLEEKNRRFSVENSLVEDRMKKWRDFQTEDGKFDAAAWNAWVKGSRNQSQKQNWNTLYQDVREGISRQVYIDMVMAASARVLDSDINKELEENHTKMKIKYAKIDPAVDPTAEQIQAYYDGHKEDYKTPDQVKVDFVAVSLRPDVPQKALDLIKQAREGADFAKLATDNSDAKSSNGGDMGWQKARDDEPAHRKPLFDLAVGQVSDAIYGFNSYYIYKVEEERTDPDTNKREVHARQIMIKAELPKEELSARQAKAKAISEQADKLKDLKAAAAEAGLEVQSTDKFTKESKEIKNVSAKDVYDFRKAFEKPAEEVSYNVVSGRDNLYVTQVTEREEGVIPPIEEVREKAREDTIADLKTGDEFKNKVKEYADKIKAQAKTIDDIATLFPELKVEVKETAEPFTRKDFLYKDQLYLQTTQIYDTLGKGEPGVLGGPLQDYRGETFFVQLVEKTPPTEEDKKGWDEERKQLRDTKIRMASNDLVEDFCQNLREKELPQVKFTTNQALIDKMLGRGQEAENEEEGKKEENKDGAQDPNHALNQINNMIGE